MLAECWVIKLTALENTAANANTTASVMPGPYSLRYHCTT
jgi:hypothetical protein